MLRYAYDTRVAYYRYQADRALVELYRTASETFLAAWEAAEDMHDVGNLRALDVSQQRAAYERSRVDVVQAELRALLSREELQVRLGLDGAQTWEVVEAWEPPASLEADGLERLAVEHNLVLAAQQQTLFAWSRRVGTWCSQRLSGSIVTARVDLRPDCRKDRLRTRRRIIRLLDQPPAMNSRDR